MADYKNAGKFEVFDASKYRVGIVVSQFNFSYTEAMLNSAKEALKDYSVPEENIVILRVAGSMETPVALQALADLPAQAGKGNFDCLVAIGVIIRGETPHFDYVAKTVTDGALRVGLDYKIPVGFGVITANNEEQVKARLHLGRGAVIAALHSAREIKNLSL